MKTILIFLSICWPLMSVCQSNSLNGEEIVTRFLVNVEKNYPHVPLVHHTFLMETETLTNGKKLYSNIAAIEYLREGYFALSSDRMKLIQGKNEIHIDTLFEDHLYGGLAEIKKDIIKYPREFLELSKSVYAYELVDKIDDNQSVYKVSFTPASKKAKYVGYLYFEPSNFALVKAEYKLSPYGIELLNKLHAGMSFKWNEINETVEYQKPKDLKHYLDEHDRYRLAKIITKGTGFHDEWNEDLIVTTELKVIDTNRTTFFANEYYKINDNIALSNVDFKKNMPGTDSQGKSITHAELVAQESASTAVNTILGKDYSEEN